MGANGPRASRKATTAPASVRVTRERNGRVLSVTLDVAGAGNRLPAAAALRLCELAEEFEDDQISQVMIIQGARGSFCSGFDDDVTANPIDTIGAVSKPVVAAIDGVAQDEGLELALACDIRVASRRARFGIKKLTRGQLPRFGATQRLPRLVGLAVAFRMLFLGEELSAAQASRVGLVTYTADTPAGLRRRTREVVASLLEKGPLALRLVKEAVLKGYDMTLAQGIRLEEDLYALLQTTADRAEGIRAFLDKRRPLFKGE